MWRARDQSTDRLVAVKYLVRSDPGDLARFSREADVLAGLDHPGILQYLDHGTSEEFGVKALHDHLVTAFPDLQVIHFQQGCSYQWITA